MAEQRTGLIYDKDAPKGMLTSIFGDMSNSHYYFFKKISETVEDINAREERMFTNEQKIIKESYRNIYECSEVFIKPGTKVHFIYAESMMVFMTKAILSYDPIEKKYYIG